MTKLHIALCPPIQKIEEVYALTHLGAVRLYIPLSILPGKKLPDKPILALARVISMQDEQVLNGGPPTQMSLFDTDDVCIIASPSTYKIDGVKRPVLQLSRLPAIQRPISDFEVGGMYGVRCSIQELQRRANTDTYLPFQQGKITYYFSILACEVIDRKCEVVVKSVHGHRFSGIALDNDGRSCRIKLRVN